MKMLFKFQNKTKRNILTTINTSDKCKGKDSILIWNFVDPMNELPALTNYHEARTGSVRFVDTASRFIG